MSLLCTCSHDPCWWISVESPARGASSALCNPPFGRSVSSFLILTDSSGPGYDLGDSPQSLSPYSSHYNVDLLRSLELVRLIKCSDLLSDAVTQFTDSFFLAVPGCLTGTRLKGKQDQFGWPDLNIVISDSWGSSIFWVSIPQSHSNPFPFIPMRLIPLLGPKGLEYVKDDCLLRL